MKRISKLAPVLAICFILLLVSGCESTDTINAGMDGMILTDTNGRQWAAKHKLGDNYHLYEVKEGKINWEGN